jgi:hypothetical protein
MLGSGGAVIADVTPLSGVQPLKSFCSGKAVGSGAAYRKRAKNSKPPEAVGTRWPTRPPLVMPGAGEFSFVPKVRLHQKTGPFNAGTVSGPPI